MKKSKEAILLVWLSALTIWFFWEFSQNVSLSNIPWTYVGIHGLFYLVGIASVMYTIGVKFFEKNIFAYLITVAMLLSFGAVGIAAVLSVLVVLISATLVGSIVFKTMGINQDNSTYYTLYFSVGIGIYAVLVSFMALIPINYPITYYLILFIPILVWFRELKILFLPLIDIHRIVSERISRYWFSSFGVFLLSLIYLSIALLPEFGHDAQTHHLRVPSYMFDHHLWNFNGAEHYGAVLPLNGNWIFSIVYMVGGESGVRLMNLVICGIITLYIGIFVNRWHLKNMYSISFLFFLSMPVTYLVTTSLFIENPLTLFITAAFYSFILYFDKLDKCFLYISAFLLGVSMGTKVQTVFIVFSLSLALLSDRHILLILKQSKGLLRGVGISILLFMAIGIIPYVVAYMKTGNPLFPYYNAIFKSPYHDMNKSFNPAFWREGINFETLKKITFFSEKYIEGQIGSAGWYFFILFPFICLSSFLYRKKQAFFFGVTAVIFIITVFQFQSYLRYIYPVYPLLIVFIVQGIGRLREESKIVGNIVYTISWILIFLNVMFLPAANFWYRDFNFSALFSPIDRKSLIYERAPYRQAVDYINTIEKSNINVCIAMTPLIWELKARPFNANVFSHPFSNAFYYADTEEKMLKLIKQNSIHYLLVDQNYHFLKIYNVMPIIEKITRVEKQFGDIAVRVLNDELSFNNELIKNPNFETIEGWSLTDTTGYQKKDRTIIVTSSNVATQAISVKPGEKLRMIVRVRCVKDKSLFRMQINWHNNKGKFIGTDLTPYTCSPDFKDYVREITVPLDANLGIIYANGHGQGDIIEFARVSLLR